MKIGTLAFYKKKKAIKLKCMFINYLPACVSIGAYISSFFYNMLTRRVNSAYTYGSLGETCVVCKSILLHTHTSTHIQLNKVYVP